MNLANRTFKNNKTGEIVKVLDSFENIAILENKQKLDVRTLTDTNHFTEQIDPSIFFNTQGAYNSLVDKIKNIPTNMMQDDPEDISSRFGGEDISSKFGSELMPSVNESAVVMMTEEDEKAELARKYGASFDNTTQVQSQQEAFARILGDESDELPQIPQRQQPSEQVMRVEVNREEFTESVVQQQKPIQQVQSVEDPIITMFRKTKRNVNFDFNVKISEKIPRLDFIEMMEDSYEISMIDFLAEEFTNKILQDPSQIKEVIKSKIKQLVYGGKSDNSNIDNSQITDTITQVEKEPVLSKDLPKKTTTRKPRTKKEDSEK